jgi:hypothetical protein
MDGDVATPQFGAKHPQERGRVHRPGRPGCSKAARSGSPIGPEVLQSQDDGLHRRPARIMERSAKGGSRRRRSQAITRSTPSADGYDLGYVVEKFH